MNDVVEKDNESLVKGIVAIGALIAVVVIGIGIYSGKKDDSRVELAEKLFQFTEVEFKEYVDGKRTSDNITKKFENLISDSMDKSSAVVPGIQIADQLYKNAAYADASKVLGLLSEATDDQFALNFIYTRYATSLEQDGKMKEAIEALKKVLQLKRPLYKEKVYFDLGRLYLAMGDKDNARKSLEFVLKESKDETLLGLGRAYLQKI